MSPASSATWGASSLVDGLDELVGLLDDAAAEARGVLLPVPGAAVGRAKPRDYRIEPAERRGRFFFFHALPHIPTPEGGLLKRAPADRASAPISEAGNESSPSSAESAA